MKREKKLWEKEKKAGSRYYLLFTTISSKIFFLKVVKKGVRVTAWL